MWVLRTQSEMGMRWCRQAGYSGNAPAVGFAKMQADANADAVLNESGGEVLVTEVDTVNKSVGILF